MSGRRRLKIKNKNLKQINKIMNANTEMLGTEKLRKNAFELRTRKCLAFARLLMVSSAAALFFAPFVLNMPGLSLLAGFAFIILCCNWFLDAKVFPGSRAFRILFLKSEKRRLEYYVKNRHAPRYSYEIKSITPFHEYVIYESGEFFSFEACQAGALNGRYAVSNRPYARGNVCRDILTTTFEHSSAMSKYKIKSIKTRKLERAKPEAFQI
jgi:hypothetical protein